LFGSEGADSIKHKILIRLINLLSSKAKVRKDLYERMNCLYKARSALVHGLPKDNKFYFTVYNLKNYEKIVRIAILILVKTMAVEKLNHKGMLHKLDYDKSDIYEIDMSSIHWIEDTKASL
jgi:hypothetical protein